MTASMLSSSQVSHHFCGRSVTIARGVAWPHLDAQLEICILTARRPASALSSRQSGTSLFSPGVLHLLELSPVSAISLALPIRKGTVGPVVEQHTCSIGRVFADLGQ